MKIRGIKGRNTLKEIQEEVYKLDNPYWWEHYCGACDHFETSECPFRGSVFVETDWTEIHCKHFWD